MLKHVQISPMRNRADSVSLRSSTSCASSICGSPEPLADIRRTPSRASSYSSLNEQLPQTTIKVFTSSLRIDIEYKTLGIQWDTTSKQVIAQLLRRLKILHRDPRLFYLSMEVSSRREGVRTVLMLDDDTRPAILQACHPKGESRFCLQLKPGGLIRVHTSALQPTSQYKSLVISEETTSDELLQLLLSCYNSLEPVEHFSIYEVCPGQEYQRKLHPDDIPLRALAERTKRAETCHFLVRRNPNYSRRRPLLGGSSTAAAATTTAVYPPPVNNSSIVSLDDDTASLMDISIESLSDDLSSLMTSDEDDETDVDVDVAVDEGADVDVDVDVDSNSSASSSSGSSSASDHSADTLPRHRHQHQQQHRHQHPRAVVPTARTNEFHPKRAGSLMQRQRLSAAQLMATTTAAKALSLSPSPSSPRSSASPTSPTYNPVYNIREIRTVSHSFSALGSDKKLLDIHISGGGGGGRFDAATCRVRPQSVFIGRTTPKLSIAPALPDAIDCNGNTTAGSATPNATAIANGGLATTSVGGEAVNNNPAKGLGHFVYI